MPCTIGVGVAGICPAIWIAGSLVRIGALESRAEPRDAAAEDVFHGWSARSDDRDGRFDCGVRRGDAVAIYLALECIEEPEEAGKANSNDYDTEREESDCDDLSLDRYS